MKKGSEEKENSSDINQDITEQNQEHTNVENENELFKQLFDKPIEDDLSDEEIQNKQKEVQNKKKKDLDPRDEQKKSQEHAKLNADRFKGLMQKKDGIKGTKRIINWIFGDDEKQYKRGMTIFFIALLFLFFLVFGAFKQFSNTHKTTSTTNITKVKPQEHLSNSVIQPKTHRKANPNATVLMQASSIQNAVHNEAVDVQNSVLNYENDNDIKKLRSSLNNTQNNLKNMSVRVQSDETTRQVLNDVSTQIQELNSGIKNIKNSSDVVSAVSAYNVLAKNMSNSNKTYFTDMKNALDDNEISYSQTPDKIVIK